MTAQTLAPEFVDAVAKMLERFDVEAFGERGERADLATAVQRLRAWQPPAEDAAKDHPLLRAFEGQTVSTEIVAFHDVLGWFDCGGARLPAETYPHPLATVSPDIANFELVGLGSGDRLIESLHLMDQWNLPRCLVPIFATAGFGWTCVDTRNGEVWVVTLMGEDRGFAYAAIDLTTALLKLEPVDDDENYDD